jgi:hypothetical protein
MIEKKNTRQFFSLLLILISSISCNKNNVLQKSKKELLTQKNGNLLIIDKSFPMVLGAVYFLLWIVAG